MTSQGLAAAYEEAAKDPEYMAEQRRIAAAWDGTVGDGL